MNLTLVEIPLFVRKASWSGKSKASVKQFLCLMLVFQGGEP